MITISDQICILYSSMMRSYSHNVRLDLLMEIKRLEKLASVKGLGYLVEPTQNNK